MALLAAVPQGLASTRATELASWGHLRVRWARRCLRPAEKKETRFSFGAKFEEKNWRNFPGFFLLQYFAMLRYVDFLGCETYKLARKYY